MVHWSWGSRGHRADDRAVTEAGGGSRWPVLHWRLCKVPSSTEMCLHDLSNPSSSIRLTLLLGNIRKGEGDGTPLQYFCLENPIDGGAWWVAVHGVSKSRTRLSDFTFTFHFMHWRRKWQPTPLFLPGESQGWGSLVGCRPWGRTELDTTEAT